MKKRRKICIVVSSEMTVRAFLMRHIAALSEKYDVSVVVNTSNTAFLKQLGLSANLVSIPIERKISPLKDLYALLRLAKLFKDGRFDVVHSMTPKAGLLAMLAAKAARVPVRVHIFTGQVWVVKKGFARCGLKWIDKMLAGCATHLLTDSNSQKKFLVDEGVATDRTLKVLANGSICGVDTERFCFAPESRSVIRSSLGISGNEIVLLYIGRLNRDKGLLDLAAAFAKLCACFNNVKLVVVGTDEQEIRQVMASICREWEDRLFFVDFTDQPEKYMSAADIVCLPSYREGFGSVIIEAAAVGLPSVASKIYGLTDAVDDGETGLLHEPGNVEELTRQLHKLIQNPEFRSRVGANARIRAERHFSGARVTAAWLEYYGRILEHDGKAFF
ncbi:MAG: hypothetical protein A3J24_01195 [Deltaproteobacteria bacterium RIFCSPLOWO2_02_FULL_53_8]|nr:MAG: hypothetical protein A3J24_01195 [Deltaproteobacteria bacterium RIFCSPLOWO2_02_FULL_53_8]